MFTFPLLPIPDCKESLKSTTGIPDNINNSSSKNRGSMKIVTKVKSINSNTNIFVYDFLSISFRLVDGGKEKSSKQNIISLYKRKQIILFKSFLLGF